MLNRNEKVEQHIRKKKKDHKHTALRFWVECDISLYVSSSFILVRSPR